MANDKLKQILAMMGFILFYVTMIAAALLLAFYVGGCAALERFAAGAPMERTIFNVQTSHQNCMVKAMAIARIRSCYGLKTKIVICYTTGGVWHAVYRDENGALHDVHANSWILFTPMFEFTYTNNMKWRGDNTIYLGESGMPYMAWRLWDHWPKYEIIAGEGRIKILQESAAWMPGMGSLNLLGDLK